MSQRANIYGPDCIPLTFTTGAPLDRPDADPQVAGYTLAPSTTYVYDLGRQAKESPYQGFHVSWPTGAILTISVEESIFWDVNLYSSVVGQWTQCNVAGTMYVSTTSTDGTTGGATVTANVITVAGSGAGAALIKLAYVSSLRTRLKIVVGATGGAVRVAASGKD